LDDVPRQRIAGEVARESVDTGQSAIGDVAALVGIAEAGSKVAGAIGRNLSDKSNGTERTLAVIAECEVTCDLSRIITRIRGWSRTVVYRAAFDEESVGLDDPID